MAQSSWVFGASVDSNALSTMRAVSKREHIHKTSAPLYQRASYTYTHTHTRSCILLLSSAVLALNRTASDSGRNSELQQ